MINKEPIFIVGTPRSGTTLVRLILDSHPEISITPESSFFFRKLSMWDQFYPFLGNELLLQKFIKDLYKIPQLKDWLPSICHSKKLLEDNPDIKTVIDAINEIFNCYANLKGKKRWGDKTPKNLYGIDQILKYFPNAKIIIIIRDCRDVAMSLNKAEFSKVSFITAARRWHRDAEITIKMITKYPDKIYLLKYEDLLEDPNGTIKSVLRYCNLSDDPEIIDRYTHHDDDVVHTKSLLYMKPVSKDNLNKWKKEMSVRDIEECEAISGHTLRYFGYETVIKNPQLSKVKILHQSFKDVLQLISNKKNMENYYAYIFILLNKLSFRTWSKR